MSKFSERLKDERIRLAYKRQDALADALGVSTTSVSNYESGKRQPDAAYLAAFSALGADVLYILTGQHTSGELAPDEAALLVNYRAISPERKGNLTDVAAALSLKQKAEEKAG